MRVRQLFKILLALLCLSHTFFAQKATSTDTIAIQEILANKRTLKKQMNYENSIFRDFYKVKLNDLHRPNYISNRNIPFHLNRVYFQNNLINNRLSNLSEYNYLHAELIDSLSMQGSTIELFDDKINNYQPVTNLIIDEGDFLYTYVDAFIKQRRSEDFAFYIGFRNVESSASFDSELKNPQFKSKIEYKINDDINLDSYYLINRVNYDDIGLTRIPHPDSIYQVLDDYYQQRVYEKKWITSLNLKKFKISYVYHDYYETKTLSSNDTINKIKLYDHSVLIDFLESKELSFSAKTRISHGSYFSKQITNEVISAHITYQKDKYKLKLDMDLFNSQLNDFNKLSKEFNISVNAIFNNSNLYLELSSHIPSYNLLYYERAYAYPLNSSLSLNSSDNAYYTDFKTVNAEIKNEDLFYLKYNLNINNWILGINYTNISKRLNYDEVNHSFRNNMTTNNLGLHFQSNFELLSFFAMRTQGTSNLINENSLYPDHQLNLEFYSQFTLFKNLKSHIVLGSDFIINQNLNHYINYLDFFYPSDSEKVSYVQPYVKAKFTIKDLDFILTVRNPLKITSVQNKGYKSFAYGTTFKILWSFYD